jgi:hypothetical protein
VGGHSGGLTDLPDNRHSLEGLGDSAVLLTVAKSCSSTMSFSQSKFSGKAAPEFDCPLVVVETTPSPQAGIGSRVVSKPGESPQHNRLVLACGGHYTVWADCHRVDSLFVTFEGRAERNWSIPLGQTHTRTVLSSLAVAIIRGSFGLKVTDVTTSPCALRGGPLVQLRPSGTSVCGLLTLDRLADIRNVGKIAW